MTGIAPDGDRLDADQTLDDAAVSITDEMLASLKTDAANLADAIEQMKTATDKATAEASFELELMKSIERLTGLALDYARKTAATPAADSPSMPADPALAATNRTRRARRLMFDKLAGGDASGILADARRVFRI